MSVISEVEEIYEELNSTFFNIKAEVLVAEIIENSSVSENEFIINNSGTFHRPFRRDIISVDNKTHFDKLILNLSRNGLYDYLPEGFFHQQQPTNKGDSPTELRQKQQLEEKNARKFFSPLENEFFHQRLSLETNERQILEDLSNLSDDFLKTFWKLDSDIPDVFLKKLTRILPYCHKIAGDFKLTKLVLEKLIGEKVTITKSFVAPKTKSISKNLNDTTLGANTLLNSDNSSIYNPTLNITIGPIKEEKIN